MTNVFSSLAPWILPHPNSHTAPINIFIYYSWIDEYPMIRMSLIVNGLEKSDEGALDEEQRKKLRQLKVDMQKIDEQYIRVRLCYFSAPFY